MTLLAFIPTQPHERPALLKRRLRSPSRLARAARLSVRLAGTVLCLCALPLAADENATARDGSYPLRWPQERYVWFYNPTGHPPMLDDAWTLAMIREVAARWQSCGVRLEYGGQTERVPGAIDGVNVVGWRNDGKQFSAWTTWAAHRDGLAVEADVTLYANIFEHYWRQGLDVQRELRKSVAHEFGHVLGLSHSPHPEDAMSVKLLSRADWPLPSSNDLARCRAQVAGPLAARSQDFSRP